MFCIDKTQLWAWVRGPLIPKQKQASVKAHFALKRLFHEIALFICFLKYQRILEIPGFSEMDLQMWAAILRDFLFPSWRTAGKV